MDNPLPDYCYRLLIDYHSSLYLSIFTTIETETVNIYDQNAKGEIGKGFLSALKLGFLTTLMVGGLFVAHRAIFSEAIIQDKNYETYNFIAEYIIISAIAMQIISTIKKTRALILERAGFLKHCGNIINLQNCSKGKYLC